MQTFVLYDKNPNLRILGQLADVIRDGGVVIYPTDSVYAIGCDALQARAVERIYRYRADEAGKPYSIICRDISQADTYTRISKAQFKVLNRHLPGPYTFILEAGLRLPKPLRARKTIGIRIPRQPLLRALMEQLDTPLLTASLKYDKDDLTADEYMTDPDLIAEVFDRQADALLYGGPGGGEPTTVVDLTGPEPVVVRHGAGRFEP